MKYFGERLRSVRQMKGFSLQGLSDHIGNKVSKQALNKYEKGIVVPNSEILGILANALDVQEDYFFTKEQVESGPIDFRKLSNHPVREKNQIIEKARHHLQRYLELEDIVGYQQKFNNKLTQLNAKNAIAIEQAAQLVRNEWNLGLDPINNVIQLLEENAVKIIEVDASDALDGAATWVNGEIPVIILNRNRQAHPDRKRLTALHELGHLILNLQAFSNKEVERRCHYFAGALLLPEKTLKEELGPKRTRLSFHELGLLKQQYGISMQAIVYRAKELGIIKDNYMRQFFFMFKQMGYKVYEPEEYDYQGKEASNRFDQLLYHALAEEMITMSKAAALKNQNLNDFRKENIML